MYDFNHNFYAGSMTKEWRSLEQYFSDVNG